MSERDPLGKRALFSAPIETPPAQKRSAKKAAGKKASAKKAIRKKATAKRTAARKAATKKQAAAQIARPRSTGKQALYSSPASRGPRITVECSNCGAAVPTEIGSLALKLLRPGAWWIPVLKTHSRYLHCDACEQTTWTRVRWLSVLD